MLSTPILAAQLRASERLPTDGLVALYDFRRTNFLLWSEDLTQTVWTPSAGVTRTGNRLVYDGSGALGTSAPFEQVVTTPPTANRTMTATVRLYTTAATAQTVRLKLTHGGVVNNYSPNLTVTAAAQTFSFPVAFANNNGSGVVPVGLVAGTLNAPYDVTVEWFQLNEGAAALPYERTTNAPLLADRSLPAVAAPLRSNLLAYSEDFNASVWSPTRLLTTPGSTVFMEDPAQTGPHYVAQNLPGLPDNATVYVSFRVKVLGTGRVWLQWGSKAGTFPATYITPATLAISATSTELPGLAASGPDAEGFVRVSTGLKVGAGGSTPRLLLGTEQQGAGVSTNGLDVRDLQLSTAPGMSYEKTTSGVFVDRSGVGRNLLGWGDDTAQSPWTRSASVTATGELVDGAAATNWATGCRVACSPGEVLTFSWDARRGTASNLLYSVINITGAFNVVNPTSYYANTNSAEYVRQTLTVTVPAGCTTIEFDPVRSTPAGTVYLRRLMVERGAVPGTYERPTYPGTLGSTLGPDSNDPVWTGVGLSFDGVDDYVKHPVGLTGEHTILLVVRGPTAATANLYPEVGSWGNSLFFFSQSGTTLSANLRNLSNTNTSGGSLPVPLGSTNFVAHRVSATQAVWSLNGNTRALITPVNSLDLTGSQSEYGRNFGSRAGTTQPFPGLIAWCAIYNRVLSDAETACAYRFARRQLAQRNVTI